MARRKGILSVTCFVVLFVFISQANALFDQTTSWSNRLNKKTDEGSRYFTKATYFAFMMFSAIEDNKLKDAAKIGKEASNLLRSSRGSFAEAAKFTKDLQEADKWVFQNISAVKEKLKVPTEFDIWQDIALGLKEKGAEGLIEVTIKSTQTIEGEINNFVPRLEKKERPSNEELWNTLFILTKEIMKGVIISEIFHNPR